MEPKKNKTTKMDRHLVAGKQKYEVSYVARVLGVTSADVHAAIEVVGRGRDAVVLHLVEMKGDDVIKKLVDKAFK